MRLAPVPYDPFSPGMQLVSGPAKPFVDNIGAIQPTQATVEAAMSGAVSTKQPTLTPVDFDPFAEEKTKPKLTPVDFDPFAEDEKSTFAGRVKENIAGRKAQMQNSADMYAAGDLSLPENIASQGFALAGNATDLVGEALSSVTPQPVKDLLSAGVKTVGKLPSISGRTIGEDIPQELDLIDKEHPRLAVNARTLVDAASFLGTGYGIKKGIDVARQLGSKSMTIPVVKDFVQDEGSGPRPPPPGMRPDDYDKAARESFDESSYLGAKFTPQQVADPFEKHLQSVKPKLPPSGKFTSEQQTLIDNLDELSGYGGKEMTLEHVDALDKMISQKINSKFLDTQGNVDANGRQLVILQKKLRKAVDAVDTKGNDALLNGKAFWQGKLITRDLEALAERASLSPNKGKALQAGAKALYLDKDHTVGWPGEVKEALRKAAAPNAGDSLLDFIGSRLPAIIGLGTGNLPAAAGAQMVGMAARGTKEANIARRLGKVQQKVVDTTMSKIRPVDISEPKADIALQLAAPGKLSPLGMSDQQVNIAQRLMANEPKPGPDLSGGAIKLPASQLNKLKTTLGKKRFGEFNTTAQIFKDGDMSQNQFVKDIVNKFGLTTKQARDLAKEVKTYGAPEKRNVVKDFLKDDSGSAQNTKGGPKKGKIAGREFEVLDFSKDTPTTLSMDVKKVKTPEDVMVRHELAKKMGYPRSDEEMVWSETTEELLRILKKSDDQYDGPHMGPESPYRNYGGPSKKHYRLWIKELQDRGVEVPETSLKNLEKIKPKKKGAPGVSKTPGKAR